MQPFQKFEQESESVLPPYDFSEALALPITERFEQSVAILQKHEQAEMVIRGEVSTPNRPGLSAIEIADLERSQGVSFAPEAKEFFRQWKRAEGGSGLGFHSLDRWITDTRLAETAYLIAGDYWRYADGDALIMPLSSETEKVFLYLHEDGPKIEEFAPSFSLALWRMAHDDRDEDFDEDDNEDQDDDE